MQSKKKHFFFLIIKKKKKVHSISIFINTHLNEETGINIYPYKILLASLHEF